MLRYSLFAVCLFAAGVSFAEEASRTMKLWPGDPPGEQVAGPERTLDDPNGRPAAGKSVTRITNVAVPEIHLYQPAEGKRTDTAVVICPGGGYSILAWDLEGTEVAEWLNGIGVTAAVLKYRVPTREQKPDWRAPVQDTQRAVSWVRANADKLQLNPQRIGVLGFSAGGKTAAMTALKAGERQYEPTDEADEASCRPDFAVLVYPAYLVDDSNNLRPEVTVTENAPHTFFAHAYDDRITPENSIQLFSALKKAGVRSELHVYAEGGHGFGLRRNTGLPAPTWPDRCEAWMINQKLLEPRK